MNRCEECRADFDEGVINEAGVLCEPCWDKSQVQSALDAGIPLSVILGKTKLRDHFSQEYIDLIRGKSNETQ